MTLNLPTLMAAVGLVLWIAAQYGLIALALRDLRRRPSVRGGNRVAWALAILAVPFIGPFLYAAYHPGAFPAAPRRLPRAPRRGVRPRTTPLAEAAAGTCPPETCPPERSAAVNPPRRRRRRPLDHPGRAR